MLPAAITPMLRVSSRMTERLVTDLPEPDLADERERLAGGDRQVDIVDRRDLAAADAEDRSQSLDVEYGFGGLFHRPPQFSRPVARRISSIRAVSASFEGSARPRHRRQNR